MKRIFTTLFALCLVASAAWAATGDTFTYQDGTGYNLEYQVNDDGTTVTCTRLATGTSSGAADLVIPDKVTNVNDFEVTAIGNYAFDGCGFTGSLIIGENVRSIGEQSFHNCGFTGSLTIGENVMSIGRSAFYSCSSFTGTLTIGENVKSIGEIAFYGCSSFTGSLTIGQNVESIGQSAFQNCSSFTGTLTIGENVKSIGFNSFKSCNGLTKVVSLPTTPPAATSASVNTISTLPIIVPNAEAAEAYKNADGWRSFSNYVYGDSYYTITYHANDGTDNTSEQLAMPDNMVSLKTDIFTRSGYYLAGWATEASATTVAYTAGEEFAPTEDIELYAVWYQIFTANTTEGYALEYAIVSGTQTAVLIGIDEDVKAPGEADLVIPASITHNSGTYTVTSIGANAFANYSDFTGTLTIGENIESIGNYAFASCYAFTAIKSLPTAPPTITENSFADMTHIPLIVADAAAAAAYKENAAWNLFENYIYGTYYTITYHANGGEGDNSEQLAMADNTSRLDENMFWREDYYFVGWATASTATQAEYAAGEEFTPTADTELYAVWTETFTAENNAEGYALKYAILPGTQTAVIVGIDEDVKYPCEDDLVIPASITHNSIDYTVTSIGEYAFSNYYDFTGSLTIGENVTSIGYAAFYYSSFTGSLTIPDKVETIGDYAFCECYYFDGSLTIGENVTSIGVEAFYYCGFTGSLTIPNKVETIGDYAFCECYYFDGSLTIGENVTSIGDEAFYSCDFTGSLTIPNKVETIGESAFEDCTGFDGSLTIGENVTTIADYAFGGCSQISSIEMKRATPPTVGTGIFAGMTACTSVSVPYGYTATYDADTQNGDVDADNLWQGMTIAEAIATDISDTQAPAPFTQVDNTLYFSKPIAVAVYNLSGVMIYSGTITEYTLPSRKGIYIICTNTGAYKVMR